MRRRMHVSYEEEDACETASRDLNQGLRVEGSEIRG
jgi:hypothetical protein